MRSIIPKFSSIIAKPLPVLTLQGHTDCVDCCTVFANDTRALSGSFDETLKVWDLSNGEELDTLQGHTDYVKCCTVFANDTRALSGSDDKTLKVWDLSNGRGTVHAPRAHELCLVLHSVCQ